MSEEIEKRGPGRPTRYSEALEEEIFERLSMGEPLAEICRDETMPGLRTIYNWEQSIEGFLARIARLREVGYDMIAADTLRIADNSDDDYEETENGPRFNAENVMRSKLRVETRLKLLAKWDRKRYGEEKGETNVNFTNQVNVVTINEDRRKELIEKRRAANQRLKEMRVKAKEIKDTEKP